MSRFIEKDHDGRIIHIYNPGDYRYEEIKEWFHQRELESIERSNQLKRKKFKRI